MSSFYSRVFSVSGSHFMHSIYKNFTWNLIRHFAPPDNLKISKGQDISVLQSFYRSEECLLVIHYLGLYSQPTPCTVMYRPDLFLCWPEPPIKKIRENKLLFGLIYGLSFRIQAASYFPQSWVHKTGRNWRIPGFDENKTQHWALFSGKTNQGRFYFHWA